MWIGDSHPLGDVSKEERKERGEKMGSGGAREVISGEREVARDGGQREGKWRGKGS